jgi:aspartokinase-like uncharacterized kinase
MNLKLQSVLADLRRLVRRISRDVFTAAVLGVGVIVSALAQSDEPRLTILSPPNDSFVSGPTVLRASVEPPGTATGVTFFADGRQICALTREPFECEWDAGPAIAEHQVRVVGTLGAGGRLVQTVRTKGVGYSERVNVDVLRHIAQDYIPVIASVGADREGASYNVNADEAAGAVAAAMGAYKVMFLTDVDGWLRDPDDPGSVISEAGADEVEEVLDDIAGGMRPKLKACLDAIHGGVTFAHIVDGRVPHSLLLELFTDAGIGTKIRPAV